LGVVLGHLSENRCNLVGPFAALGKPSYEFSVIGFGMIGHDPVDLLLEDNISRRHLSATFSIPHLFGRAALRTNGSRGWPWAVKLNCRVQR
jgi:hypothetical protein